MDVANEILDAIEIIVDKKIRENTAQIYPGVCKSVSGNSCVMSINGRDNTVQFYGSMPTVGTIYRVFVPNGNMSTAFILVASGLQSEIRVTAKAGALLNLHYKDSSIILQSYQLGASETTHTFVVNVSKTAYVVEDVANSASVEVLVDTVGVFKAEIRYKLWLYRDGDEYDDVTGGFYSNTSWWNTSNRGTATKNADNSITIYCPNGSYFSCYTTRNKIDVSNFSTLNLNVVSVSWFGTGYREMYLVSNSSDDSTVVKSISFDATGIRTIDVSGITGSYYVALYGNSQTSGACSMTFDKIWLE